MPRSGAGPHPMRGILLFRTWACCPARGPPVPHVGLLFRTWACCFARGLAVPHVGGVAHARNSGFACGIEGRHADKPICGPGVCRTLAGTECSQERNARRNGRTDLTIGRETGTVAQQETETLVRFGAQIRQSTPNRMRLSARRPLVAAEFGARGITVRRAPQPYDSLHANARRGDVDQPTRGMRHSRVLPDEA